MLAPPPLPPILQAPDLEVLSTRFASACAVLDEMESLARGFRDTAAATAGTHTTATAAVLGDYRRRLCLQFGVAEPATPVQASHGEGGGGPTVEAAAAAPGEPPAASLRDVPDGGSVSAMSHKGGGGGSAASTGSGPRRSSVKINRSTPKLGTVALVEAERAAEDAAATAAHATAVLEALKRAALPPPPLCRTLQPLAEVYQELEVRRPACLARSRVVPLCVHPLASHSPRLSPHRTSTTTTSSPFASRPPSPSS